MRIWEEISLYSPSCPGVLYMTRTGCKPWGVVSAFWPTGTTGPENLLLVMDGVLFLWRFPPLQEAKCKFGVVALIYKNIEAWYELEASLVYLARSCFKRQSQEQNKNVIWERWEKRELVSQRRERLKMAAHSDGKWCPVRDWIEIFCIERPLRMWFLSYSGLPWYSDILLNIVK